MYPYFLFLQLKLEAIQYLQRFWIVLLRNGKRILWKLKNSLFLKPLILSFCAILQKIKVYS
jgi:hypothetical protein